MSTATAGPCGSSVSSRSAWNQSRVALPRHYRRPLPTGSSYSSQLVPVGNQPDPGCRKNRPREDAQSPPPTGRPVHVRAVGVDERTKPAPMARTLPRQRSRRRRVDAAGRCHGWPCASARAARLAPHVRHGIPVSALNTHPRGTSPTCRAHKPPSAEVRHSPRPRAAHGQTPPYCSASHWTVTGGFFRTRHDCATDEARRMAGIHAQHAAHDHGERHGAAAAFPVWGFVCPCDAHG